MSEIRTFKLTEDIADFVAGDTFEQLFKQENTFYLCRSSVFNEEDPEKHVLRTISMKNWAEILEGKITWLDPLKLSKALCHINLNKIKAMNLRLKAEYDSMKALKAEVPVVAEPVVEVVAEKPKRARKVAPIKIIY